MQLVLVFKLFILINNTSLQDVSFQPLKNPLYPYSILIFCLNNHNLHWLKKKKNSTLYTKLCMCGVFRVLDSLWILH